MWPNFILREFAAVRAMKILGRKNEIVSYSLGHLRKQSKIGYNTMGNIVIEGNS